MELEEVRLDHDRDDVAGTELLGEGGLLQFVEGARMRRLATQAPRNWWAWTWPGWNRPR